MQIGKFLHIRPKKENLKGMSSKAYIVWLKKRTVYAMWGSVQALGGGGGTLRWFSKPQTKKWPCTSEAEAKREFERNLQKRKYHHYDRLPSWVRIYKAKKVG